MVNILAGLELVAAATRLEGAPATLLIDAATLFGAYETAKGGNAKALAHDPRLPKIIEAATNVMLVANALAKDPNQLKNIVDLLASL